MYSCFVYDAFSWINWHMSARWRKQPICGRYLFYWCYSFKIINQLVQRMTSLYIFVITYQNQTKTGPTLTISDRCRSRSVLACLNHSRLVGPYGVINLCHHWPWLVARYILKIVRKATTVQFRPQCVKSWHAMCKQCPVKCWWLIT